MKRSCPRGTRGVETHPARVGGAVGAEMMHHPYAREAASPSDDGRSDSGSLANDPEEIVRAMESCRPYLLQVANKEIAPGLRPKGGASDLVQETYLEAHRDLAQFSGRSRGELRGWLRRILRNNLANFVRRYRVSRKRRVGLEVSLEGHPLGVQSRDGLASTSPSPSSQAIRTEQALMLELARSRLGERDRLVLTWRTQDHCDWEEIGRRLGGTEGKARKIWTRAVEQLRREVGDDPGSSTSGQG